MPVTEAFTILCPHCSKTLNVPPQLAGKRAKCSCGQVIQLPTSPNQAPQAAHSAAPTVPLGYRTHHPHQQSAAEEHSTLVRQAIIYSSLLVLLIAAVFTIRFLGQRSNQAAKTARANMPGEDALVTDMISRESGTEARQWLSEHKGRMLGGMTDSQAEARIDAWYKMGATKVYAFGGMMSMSVALELPSDPAKRKALIDWTNDWNAKSFAKPQSDMGQKYLLVRLHL